MKKALFLVAAAALAAALLAGCSNAVAPAPTVPVGDGNTPALGEDKSLEQIVSKGELIVGIDDAFVPMAFRNDKNEIVGCDIDLAAEVAKRLGVKLKLRPVDRSARQQELDAKNIDCIWGGLSASDENRPQAEFSNPYLENRIVLVAREGGGITKLSHMKGKKLALRDGSSAASALDSHAELKNTVMAVVQFKEDLLCLNELEAGGVDAVLTDEVVARYYIAALGKKFVILNENIAAEKYAVAFRKGERALTDAVNRALSDMAGDGTLERLSKQWFG